MGLVPRVFSRRDEDVRKNSWVNGGRAKPCVGKFSPN